MQIIVNPIRRALDGEERARIAAQVEHRLAAWERDIGKVEVLLREPAGRRGSSDRPCRLQVTLANGKDDQELDAAKVAALYEATRQAALVVQSYQDALPG